MISLSPTETEIMEVLWNSGGMTNNDIVVYFKGLGKEWKRQTTSTFLTRMMQKGLVIKEGHRYAARYTKEEFERKQAREILDSMYNGSLKNFIAALDGGEQMTEGERKELKDLLGLKEEA